MYISQNKIIAETYNDYLIFVFEVYTHCPLTLTCENDILFLLYYVLHFYKCNKTNNFQYYMTNGRGTSIVYGGHIGIAEKIAYRSKNCGGTYDMVFTIILNYLCTNVDTCIQFENTLTIFEGLPTPPYLNHCSDSQII